MVRKEKIIYKEQNERLKASRFLLLLFHFASSHCDGFTIREVREPPLQITIYINFTDSPLIKVYLSIWRIVQRVANPQIAQRVANPRIAPLRLSV